MRSEKEWQRLDSSYCHGIVVPLETIDDYINAIISVIRPDWLHSHKSPSTSAYADRLISCVSGYSLAGDGMQGLPFASAAWVTQGLHLREIFEIDELLPAALANKRHRVTPGRRWSYFGGERLSNHRLRAYGPVYCRPTGLSEKCLRAGQKRVAVEFLLRTIVQPSAILVGPEQGISDGSQSTLSIVAR